MKPTSPMSGAGETKLPPKYAWREVDCHGLPKRSAPERAADFLEIYGMYDEASAREQASRCIQCPNPTCVNGCPLCNPIPQWMQLTAEGRFLEAAAVLGSATNLAEICTRLCPSDHLCEESCILEGINEPVAIGALEQFLVEYAFAKGAIDISTAPPNGKRIAVVGSSPGALACAEELAKRGYAVTVFDSELVPGGLLVNGVPAFKVEQSVIQRRLDVLKKRGIKFSLGVRLWKEVTLDTLREQFDSVYLGMDSRRARALNVPGADLKGVIQGIAFLLQKNTPVTLDLKAIDVKGKKVVVLGGGDTAMDCLRAAIRCGANETTCVYRRGEGQMPCGRHEYENAREEGARFLFNALALSIADNGRGEVTGLRLAQTEQAEATSVSGNRERPPVRIIPGTEFDLEADCVILALGFEASACPDTGSSEAFAVNEWGGLLVDAQQRTSVRRVYAGGDLVRGPSSILLAVRDGRHAAEQIHHLLQKG